MRRNWTSKVTSKRAEEEEMKPEKEKKEKRRDAADKPHEMASAALGVQIKEYSEKVEI